MFFFIIEKSEETTLNFSQNSITIISIMKTRKIGNLLNSSDNENSKFEKKNGILLTVKQKAIIQQMKK